MSWLVNITSGLALVAAGVVFYSMRPLEFGLAVAALVAGLVLWGLLAVIERLAHVIAKRWS